MLCLCLGFFYIPDKFGAKRFLSFDNKNSLLFRFVFSCRVVSCLVLPCIVMPCLGILWCVVFSCHVLGLSCLALSCVLCFVFCVLCRVFVFTFICVCVRLCLCFCIVLYCRSLPCLAFVTETAILFLSLDTHKDREPERKDRDKTEAKDTMFNRLKSVKTAIADRGSKKIVTAEKLLRYA